MSLALKLALAPLLVVQGRRTRATATRLPEAAGAREGMAGEGVPLRLLVLGDSSAAGVGVGHQRDALAAQLAPALAQLAGRAVHWRLVARSGLNTLKAEALWRKAGTPAADVAVLVTGVNDVTDQLPAIRTLRAREALELALQREAGVRHVVHTPLPPMHAFSALPQPLRWVLGRDALAHNRALAQWAAAGGPQRSLLALDLPLDSALLASDGFHPGPQVYALWAQALAAHIHRHLS